MTSATKSLWHATHQVRHFPSLNHDLAVDVAVVGGGVSGVTAAMLLARAAKRVALLERDKIGSGETGYTTSHLTEAVDGRCQTIVNRFGEARARLVGQASRDAIDRIEQCLTALAIDCGFERVNGYLYTERESDIDWLARELDAARRAGGRSVSRRAHEAVRRTELPYRRRRRSPARRPTPTNAIDG